MQSLLGMYIPYSFLSCVPWWCWLRSTGMACCLYCDCFNSSSQSSVILGRSWLQDLVTCWWCPLMAPSVLMSMLMATSMRLSHFPMHMGSLKMGHLKQKTAGFQGMLAHSPLLPYSRLFWHIFNNSAMHTWFVLCYTHQFIPLLSGLCKLWKCMRSLTHIYVMVSSDVIFWFLYHLTYWLFWATFWAFSRYLSLNYFLL